MRLDVNTFLRLICGIPHLPSLCLCARRSRQDSRRSQVEHLTPAPAKCPSKRKLGARIQLSTSSYPDAFSTMLCQGAVWQPRSHLLISVSLWVARTALVSTKEPEVEMPIPWWSWGRIWRPPSSRGLRYMHCTRIESLYSILNDWLDRYKTIDDRHTRVVTKYIPS